MGRLLKEKLLSDDDHLNLTPLLDLSIHTITVSLYLICNNHCVIYFSKTVNKKAFSKKLKTIQKHLFIYNPLGQLG